LPTLFAGGAERILSFLPQHLSADKFDAQLLIAGKFEDAVYQTGKVKVTYLEKDRVLHAIPGIFKFIKANNPDVVLSSIGHLNLLMGLMAFLFWKPKFIIRPSNIRMAFSKKHSLLWQIGLPKIDKVVCQSQDMAENFSEIAKIPMHKIAVIGNPITNLKSNKIEREISQYRNLITVGRLNKVKGHERILKILAKLDFDFNYTIIGDGPEKENIEHIAKKYNLDSKIQMVPYTDKVDEYLSNSDLFLQGSYSEGFPNAILESCTLGIPVLAFDVPGGTKEIIEHGKNGFLAKSEDEYLRFLNLNKEWNCGTVRNSVVSKFSPDKIVNRYEELFLSAAGHRGS